MIWCGIDWAERHHDVALVDDDGKLIAKRRVGDDLSGFTALLELLTEHRAISNGECATPIAIETANGLLPAALLASGFTVYAINPLAASRYRDRYTVSRAKSDAGDALVLANVLRTDRSASADPSRLRTRASRQGARSRPARRGLGASTSPEQAPVATARVLRVRTGHLR